MKNHHNDAYNRLLAIDPCTKGFGFAVMEGKGRLVDWGVARLWSGRSEEFVVRVEGLVDRYQPSTIVLEDLPHRFRDGRRADRLCALADYVGAWKAQAVWVSRAAVKEFFGDTDGTKHEIARVIAEAFPELRQHLPPPRKLWMSEDERMNLFDAMSFLLVTRGSLGSNDVPSLR